MRRVLAGACALLIVAGACGDDDGDAEVERHASAWEEVIRRVELDALPPSTEDGDLPVVFAHEAGDDDVPAEVQVVVVNALIDDADVRFTDDPDGVVDESAEGEPVEDDGVLITMGPLPDTGDQVTVDVVRYRDATDQQTLEVVLTGGAPSWAVQEIRPVG